TNLHAYFAPAPSPKRTPLSPPPPLKPTPRAGVSDGEAGFLQLQTQEQQKRPSSAGGSTYPGAKLAFGVSDATAATATSTAADERRRSPAGRLRHRPVAEAATFLLDPYHRRGDVAGGPTAASRASVSCGGQNRRSPSPAKVAAGAAVNTALRLEPTVHRLVRAGNRRVMIWPLDAANVGRLRLLNSVVFPIRYGDAFYKIVLENSDISRIGKELLLSLTMCYAMSNSRQCSIYWE
ncbi:hypothetical protein HK405_011867, partial [Cladochytrium tenue]